ncbi:MAG: hypothetical protein K2U26_08525 [Cyclobacteriaceae bacterium]|nr:hypothetical protein [Cyclobacteriaceae bacterium]
MRIIALCFLLLVSFLTTRSQEKTKIDVRIGFVGVGGTRTTTNLNAVNSQFNDAGYPSLPSSLSLSQAGVGIWLNRWYVLALQKQFKLHSSSNASYATIGSGDGFDLLFGYNLISSSKIRLYPYIGTGYQNFSLYTDPVNPSSFSSLLSNANQSYFNTTVTNERTGTAGLGFDCIIAHVFNKRGQFSITFMGGYLYGGTSATWRVNNQLAQRPNASFSGIDASFGIQFFVKL